MVLILAGELLKKSEQLLVMGLHPSEVIKGYELACIKAVEELESMLFESFSIHAAHILSTELSTFSLPSPLTHTSLASALKPAIASKQYGYEDILSTLVAEAALAVMPPNPKNFNVDNVRVVKIMGGSLNLSRVVQGMVFGREPEGELKTPSPLIDLNELALGMLKKVTKAKVAVFTSALDIAQTETKGTVLLKNADEMLNFTRGEEQHLEKVRISY